MHSRRIASTGVAIWTISVPWSVNVRPTRPTFSFGSGWQPLRSASSGGGGGAQSPNSLSGPHGTHGGWVPALWILHSMSRPVSSVCVASWLSPPTVTSPLLATISGPVARATAVTSSLA